MRFFSGLHFSLWVPALASFCIVPALLGSGAITMKTDAKNVSALCHAYDLGKAEGIEKGRAEAINEVYAIAMNENHDTLIEWLQDHISD